MNHDLADLVTSPGELLAIGEPDHLEPAFGYQRNALFQRLIDRGYRSIALEIDRVTALAVSDFVQHGTGTLDAVMRDGFSTMFGTMAPNRELVAWMRSYNENQPLDERLTFHGFDAEMENMSAPSPRRYLEHVGDYLGLDLELGPLVGSDEQWSRQEAILDPAMSVGDSAEAGRLRVIADNLLTSLYVQAPELIEATSVAAWHRARAHAMAGLGLLRYHQQAAQRTEESTRISGLLAIRGALMAQNLLDIRSIEAERGPTLVFAHNTHVQRSRSTMPMAGMELSWCSAGAILGSLLGQRYHAIVGSAESDTPWGAVSDSLPHAAD